MKKYKILLAILVVITLSGCTKQLKDADGNQIRNEKTKQVLVENILCKPEELYDEYKEVLEKKKEDYKEKYENGDISKKEYKKQINNILDIDKLPKCKKISVIQGGYETFWTSVFVKPLAWVIVNIGKILKNCYGLAIVVVTIIIKLILFPFTYKSLKQSENMQKAQPKLKKIEKKYEGKTDQESMMMKSKETMEIYKQYKINPVSGCIIALLQIPLFFAFYEALNRLPILFEGKFMGFHLGTTPLAGAQTGHMYYLILPILVGLVTYFSFKINKNIMPSDQMKQTNMMFNIMIVMIFMTSFSMSTSIIIYWITNSLFTIIQNIIIKRSK